MIILKWVGTTLCLIGIALTSFNVYPINLVFGFTGSLAWTVAGLASRDKPLFIVELASVLVYMSGIISWGVK